MGSLLEEESLLQYLIGTLQTVGTRQCIVFFAVIARVVRT